MQSDAMTESTLRSFRLANETLSPRFNALKNPATRFRFTTMQHHQLIGRQHDRKSSKNWHCRRWPVATTTGAQQQRAFGARGQTGDPGEAPAEVSVQHHTASQPHPHAVTRRSPRRLPVPAQRSPSRAKPSCQAAEHEERASPSPAAITPRRPCSPAINAAARAAHHPPRQI